MSRFIENSGVIIKNDRGQRFEFRANYGRTMFPIQHNDNFYLCAMDDEDLDAEFQFSTDTAVDLRNWNSASRSSSSIAHK